ncbi:Uu.00g057840.m01.CDS01 [Anthostomella pinea]|uniref:Uu.00g057840.m01.CDS01 n=1 Tax=Anthostomella pinea TaxID=933095 RepID=A0AAI8VSJ9_9PEZI|nr:Uu.00g057840.m01.CDS01 [Anthostomella pinea]
MGIDGLPDIGDTSFNQKSAVAWVAQQPEESQSSLVENVFRELLDNAARPKQASGNACVKLCGFVEHCSKSNAPALRSFAFRQSTALELFNFFIEWNEQDAHKAMRIVLDCLAYSISHNSNPQVGASIKAKLTVDAVSMITQQASRPSIKSAMTTLDHLVQKKIVYLHEILEVYQTLHGIAPDGQNTWDGLIRRIFECMEQQNASSVAGKLLVTIFSHPWCETDKGARHYRDAWHRFMYSGLQSNLELLEPIKLYVFVPLFKADRTESLRYLDDLSSLQSLTGRDSRGWDLNGMLWLAMLEAGKKMGVVGEPGPASMQKMGAIAQLPAEILDSVLCHESHEARSSGVSILVASPATTKPYTPEALDLLKKHLPSFYEDTDAKFRYDVLGHSRNMVKRLQCTIDSLRKELDRSLKKADKIEPAKRDNQALSKGARGTQTDKQTNAQDDVIWRLRSTIRDHEDFISWLVGFLKSELVPTASYQRHITALRAMGFFLRSGPFQGDGTTTSRWLNNPLVDATWFRAVLDLTMDPFDDVREAAAALIMLLQSGSAASTPPEKIRGLQHSPKQELQEFCRKADELSRQTARADHSDGAARSQELLFRWSKNFEGAVMVPTEVLLNLEAKLLVAEQDLATAVLQAPIHGDFASLRYIWGSLSGSHYSNEDFKILHGLQSRAIACCQRIWQAVRHILCDDSPEGHLPEELQEVDGLDTKDLLSYSFRAIHESSNLLRVIGINARYSRDAGSIAPSRGDFETIGRLTFDELSNLRHRGAFSTVSQTFTSCCQQVKYYPNAAVEEDGLLDEWYEGALKCIYMQASTTRRSAGLPAIIVGILSSKADRPSFETVIYKLQEFARKPAYMSESDGSNLPQVHALNCIKDIFKTSFLSNGAHSYLANCLQLAANSLKSEVWAIRNCGLLLLRSLIDNLFGTSESKTSMEAGWDGRSTRLPYHKYKALPALLASLLESGMESSGVLMGAQTAESVFPALDIIRRAGPPEAFRDKLYDTIAWYLGSPIWHVREIAARSLCSFLLKPGWFTSIDSLIVDSKHVANKLHGALLTLKFLLEKLLEVMPDQLSESNIDTLFGFLQQLPIAGSCLNTCTEARAVYADILTFLAKVNPDRSPTGAATVLEYSRLRPGREDENSSVLNDQHDQRQAPLALLTIRLGDAVVQDSLRRSAEESGDSLSQNLKTALATDLDTACSMLESLSKLDLSNAERHWPSLVDAYLLVCFETDVPEPRTITLESLASLMDVILRQRSDDGLKNLPSEEVLSQLWTDLHQKPMNPSLSDAIIRVSGPIVAISVLRKKGMIDDGLEKRLRSGGAMMSDAGVADRPFDTRLAAVQAINSLSSTTHLSSNDKSNPAHLPWLLALYDALNDDDDEIRSAAASAASPVLDANLVSIEAGARLLRWLGKQYGHEPAFRTHVAGRMVGHDFSFSAVPPHTTNLPETWKDQNYWVPAQTQLQSAMRFDDALFVVEEQNLYVDEVREVRRWADVFLSLPSASSLPSSPSSPAAPDTPAKELAQWTLAGLTALNRLARSSGADDNNGPLGWTSKPQVFAICARVVTSASALAVRGNFEVRDELRRFRELGQGVGVHGLLLAMCDERRGLRGVEVS